MNGIASLVQSLSSGYLTAQALTVILLFALGLLFVTASWPLEAGSPLVDIIWIPLLAFPAGLALFSTAGYLMLCLGIPFGLHTMITALSAIAVFGVVFLLKSYKIDYIKQRRIYAVMIVISIAVATVCSVMSTINIFDVVLDNDSFFYFSTFPEAIVQEGAYIRYFDVFLTDAAPVGSIIQTLPYLFGFSETFGLQYVMNADLILVLAFALYTELSGTLGKKAGICCSAAASLFLVTSSAYLTTAKWVMAGVYFMSYFFITAFLGYRAASMTRKPCVLMALFAVNLAMMRQEGVVLTAILILCLSFLPEYSGRELFFWFICPVTAAAALYYIRVFLILGIEPLYAFLTPVKAVIMLLFLVSCGIYVLLVRDRLKPEAAALLPWGLPFMLLLLNAALAVVKPADYLGNLKMFYLNVRIGAGWGYFGYICGAVFLLLVVKAVLNRERYLLFFDSLMISYVLGVLLVAFGRGDALRKGVGDSGNRVMLTAVPVIVFSLVLRYFSCRKSEQNGGGEDAEKS